MFLKLKQMKSRCFHTVDLQGLRVICIYAGHDKLNIRKLKGDNYAYVNAADSFQFNPPL